MFWKCFHLLSRGMLYTFFKDCLLKLLRYKCHQGVTVYKKNFAFLFFICIPTFRSLVAVSLGFFHTCPVLVSLHQILSVSLVQHLCCLLPWPSYGLMTHSYCVLWKGVHIHQHFCFDISGHISCIWLVLIIVMGLNLWLESHFGTKFPNVREWPVLPS